MGSKNKLKKYQENNSFKNVSYDAIDVDFGKGFINNSNFNLIGNDAIDFSGVRKNRQGLMGSKTRVHGDRKAKHTKKIHQEEIDDAI